MKKEYDGYTVVPYPPVRKMTADILELAHPKHMIHAFVEVDVTRAHRSRQRCEAGWLHVAHALGIGHFYAGWVVSPCS